MIHKYRCTLKNTSGDLVHFVCRVLLCRYTQTRMELNSYCLSLVWCTFSYTLMCFCSWSTEAKTGVRRRDFDSEQYQPIHVGINNGIFHEPRENLDMLFHNLKARRDGPVNNYNKVFSKAHATKSNLPPTPKVRSHSKYYDTGKGLFRPVHKRKTLDAIPLVKKLFGPDAGSLHILKGDKRRTRFRMKESSKDGHDLFTKMTSNIEAPSAEIRARRSTTNGNSVEDEFTKWALILGGITFGVIILIIFICVCCKWNAVRRSKDGESLIPDFTPPVYSVTEGYDNLGCQAEAEQGNDGDRNFIHKCKSSNPNSDCGVVQGCDKSNATCENISTTAV